MKTIVISAVNLKVGGTLAILRDCLHYLSLLAEKGDYRVIALVYDRKLVMYPNIEYIEMQWPKKAWINRLWCEYVTMKKVSQQLKPVYLWFSLHDTTPNVLAEKRAVYCHNPFPFYRWKISEFFFAPKIVLFAIFSKFIYQKNIHENDYVVVQQEWIRKEFIRMFGLKQKGIIVAPPPCNHEKLIINAHENKAKEYSFIFAASPNSHKNFECLCKAVEVLCKDKHTNNFKVYITVKGDENKYARWLYAKWGKYSSNLVFIGFQNKESLNACYNNCDCLVFPSKIETWGLPITEFAAWKMPMLLADLPYAYETANGCSDVSFFHPDDYWTLAKNMKSLINGDNCFLLNLPKKKLSEPVTYSWEELFGVLLKK